MTAKKFNFIRFIKEDIWRISDRREGAVQQSLLRYSKLLLLSVRGFRDDLCLLRSSALTLYSLLSIVPVFAMLFGIAKGFGFEQILRARLLEQIPNQDSMALHLLDFAENMLANTKGGVVAGIGVIVLFWSVIKVIGNIEESFNAIWKIERGRSLSRKLSDYLSFVFLAPVLLVLSSSITVFVNTHVTWLMTVIHLPAFGKWLILKLLSLSPAVILSALFSFLFMFMPNRKVDLKAGVAAGMVTAVVYQILQWLYLSLQIGVSSYNAIYGSFAALPLFIVSLQMGWMIVLFGCELSFYLQNNVHLQQPVKFSELSLALQKAIALQIMRSIVLGFSERRPASTAGAIARELALPIPAVQAALAWLHHGGLIVELKTEDGESARFQPAFETSHLSVVSIIERLEHCGHSLTGKEIERGKDVIEAVEAELKAGYGHRLLLDI